MFGLVIVCLRKLVQRFCTIYFRDLPDSGHIQPGLSVIERTAAC